MQLEFIRNQEQLEEPAEAWNNLLTCCSASHVPFLRHEYLSTWWKTLGGGEWQEGELYTVLAKDDSGELIGIAPLFFSQNLQGEPAMLLLGSIEISDYLDIIVRSDKLDEFIRHLFDWLGSDEAPAWQVLDLYNIPEDSLTLSALARTAEQRGWDYSQEKLQPCPYIPLPGDWDTYLAGIKKKQRHEIRRKMRKAEASPVPVRWYISQDETRLDNEIEAFLSLMAQDPEKDRFLTDIMRSQMRAAVHAAFRSGWLQLAFLEVGGEKAAGYLNFDFANHIWVYNSGINFKFGELSPGWVLLGHLLKWANEQKRIYFDFMRGDEAYKYRFGGIERFVVRAIIRR